MRLPLRVLSVVLIAIGAGFVAYGLSVEPGQYHAPAGIAILYGPAECLAWGIGLAVAGLTTLAVVGVRGAAPTKPS